MKSKLAIIMGLCMFATGCFFRYDDGHCEDRHQRSHDNCRPDIRQPNNQQPNNRIDININDNKNNKNNDHHDGCDAHHHCSKYSCPVCRQNNWFNCNAHDHCGKYNCPTCRRCGWAIGIKIEIGPQPHHR